MKNAKNRNEGKELVKNVVNIFFFCYEWEIYWREQTKYSQNNNNNNKIKFKKIFLKSKEEKTTIE